MDLTLAALDHTALCDAVRTAEIVMPVGARTQWQVGGPAPARGTEVSAPAGIVTYDPADLTITAGGGTRVREIDAVLAEHGQECPLDPRDRSATVGGVLAVGLSGLRRLRLGPLRDTVLEVRVVTADGRLVKGGGPTVKNVTGYDIPRLMVGSFGTLGVIAQVTLRCRPRAAVSAWFTSERDANEVRAALYRPSCVARDRDHTYVLLEGEAGDVEAQRAAADLSGDGGDALQLPDGACRGRISVAPAALDAVSAALGEITDCSFLAEYGVGTVHVAGDDVRVLHEARAVADAHGGWLLREAGGGSGFDAFGVALPNGGVQRAIREAFDPAHTCNPGRLPA